MRMLFLFLKLLNNEIKTFGFTEVFLQSFSQIPFYCSPFSRIKIHQLVKV